MCETYLHLFEVEWTFVHFDQFIDNAWVVA